MANNIRMRLRCDKCDAIILSNPGSFECPECKKVIDPKSKFYKTKTKEPEPDEDKNKAD